MWRPRNTRRMNSSGFPADPGVPVVTDASVIINLNGTASAARDHQCFPEPFLRDGQRSPGAWPWASPMDTDAERDSKP